MTIQTSRHRGDLPPIVFARNVTGPSSAPAVTTANRGKAFLLAGDGLDSLFVSAGATPSGIGWVNDDAWAVYPVGHPLAGQPIQYVFRAAVEGDVVVWHAGAKLLRYEQRRVPGLNNESVPVLAWADFRSLPERALDDMQVFDLFDPTGVYNYYARILGAILGKTQQGNLTLRDMRDPYKAPEEYLDALAGSIGVRFNTAEANDNTKRDKIATAVPVSKRRGMAEAVEIRLRQIGYDGTLLESLQMHAQSADTLSAWRGCITFATRSNPTAGQSVSVTGAVTATFVFGSGVDGTPANTYYVTIGATALDTMSNLVAKVNGSTAITAARDLDTPVPRARLQHGGGNLVLSTSTPTITTKDFSDTWRRADAPPVWPARYLNDNTLGRELVITSQRADGVPAAPFITTGAYVSGDPYRRARGVIYFAAGRNPDPEWRVTITATTGSTAVFVFKTSPPADAPPLYYVARDGSSAAVSMANLAAKIAAVFGGSGLTLTTTPMVGSTMSPGVGESGSDVAADRFVDIPHGADDTEPLAYLPTTLLSLVLNEIDGTPVFTAAPQAPTLSPAPDRPFPELDPVRQEVLDELFLDILPVTARIRAWYTAVGPARGTAEYPGEGVAVSDSLTIT